MELIQKINFNLKNEIRLDRFLKKELKEISRSKIQRLIKENKIIVNGYPVKPSFLLINTGIIELDYTVDDAENELKAEKIKLDVIYEDDDIIAVNKASNIVVHPGIKHQQGTLLNGLIFHYKNLSNIDKQRPGIIHRLDKDTTGIIIIAKNDFSHYFISEQFANRSIKKIYKAITWGNINDKGEVEGFISRNPKNRLSFVMSDKGKYSYSTFKKNNNNDIPLSYVDVFPKTGRTHQIRVHLSSIRCPILNDELYYPGNFSLNSFHQKYNKMIKIVLKHIKRIALHAYSIEFIHPAKKEKIKLVAPIPYDFQNALEIISENE